MRCSARELLAPVAVLVLEYAGVPLNVMGGIDNLYRVDMIAKRARDTDYNTPEHYDQR